MNHLDQLSLMNGHSIALSWALLVISIFISNMKADTNHQQQYFLSYINWVTLVRWDTANRMWLFGKQSTLKAKQNRRECTQIWRNEEWRGAKIPLTGLHILRMKLKIATAWWKANKPYTFCLDMRKIPYTKKLSVQSL